MLLTTTPTVEGHPITHYHGLAFGEVINVANFGKGLAAAGRSLVGGRSEAFEKTLIEARQIAIDAMIRHAQYLGGNAVVGIKIDYEAGNGNMLTVIAAGTAVTLS